MKSIYFKLYTIIFLITISACDDNYLERYPLDEISTADYWKTTSDLKLYVNQFYPSAFSVSGSDRYNFIFEDDLPTDDMVYIEADRRLHGTRVVPATGGWDYSRIRSVNVFLENYDKSESDFEEYKQYVGEARFFRAFYYFSMVKEYGDVPWIDTPLNTGSEELYSERTPRNQVIDNIIADLNIAIDLMPSGKQEGGTRLSKEIAQLFKSRVCLYEGTWEKYHTGSPFAVENSDPQKYLQLAETEASNVIRTFQHLYSGNIRMELLLFFKRRLWKQ